ncbi:MAG TPA: hypothetical protein VHC22_28210 [Pirellulales bacterium]|nr:hypothetical protein [Pirellulales bacterium]
MAGIHSTREVADLLGIETWRVRRLFEDGTLPEPGRFAGKRAIEAAIIPRIVDALRARGWLPADQEVSPPAGQEASQESPRCAANDRRGADVAD